MPILSELVSVRARYCRAVNLSTDSKSAHALDGILVTPLVAYNLERLLDNLENPQGERSFMLFGPYGSGKSTFALFINALFGMGAREDSQAYTLLHTYKPNLAARFASLSYAQSPWFCVPLTARRSPIGKIILEGLQAALKQLPDDSERWAISLDLKECLQDENWRDSAVIWDLIERVCKLALDHNFGGFLLIVDEAGKCLEYALQDRAGGDVYLFQELAEHAKRVKEVPMLFFTVQHQNFEGYTELSNRTLRNEWAKVQERFEDLPFNEQLASGINTLGQVLQYHGSLQPPLLETIKLEAEALLRDAGAELPPGMAQDDFINICQQAWPLHPSVVLVLPKVFQRLGQNGRSLFSYLSSQEPYGFQEHCRRNAETDYGFVRLYDIANYLLANMKSTLVQRPVARTMLEILESASYDLSLLQDQILRTVGLLNVLGKTSLLKPSRSALSSFLPPRENEEDVNAALQGLQKQRLLRIRKADQSLRLWEGGDIDIEDLLQKARKRLQYKGAAFLPLVREHVSVRPLVARRHCLQSGAYRYFELEYALSAKELALQKKDRTSCEAGRILVLLPMSNLDQLEQEAKLATSKDPSLVVAIPNQLDMLREHAIELACLHLVEKHTPDLREDRLAMQEYGLLLADCERRVRQNAELLLDPRPAPKGNSCHWFWNGEQQAVQRPVDVTRLLSKVCDNLYPFAPQIKNELVARPALSATSTGSRNVLLKRMLSNMTQEKLGIEGYPAERSMYESVLRHTDLHRLLENGKWAFCIPAEESTLYAVWQAMDKEIFTNAGECIPLPRIFEVLVNPPYGVPEGLLPILLLAFYLNRTSELFLYRENSFLTDLNEANVELMQRRPDLFGISGVRLEGERRALVERYANGLHVAPTVPAVISRLYAAIRQLPHITLHTNRLSPKRGKALRDCLRIARSPERLLFDELPEAFGLPSLLTTATEAGWVEAFAAAIRESMGELMDFAPKTRTSCRDALLDACGLPSGASGWHAFVERAAFLAKRIRQGVIVPVLERTVRAESNEDHRLEGILGMVKDRAFDRWGDADIETFKDAAQGFGEQFMRAWDEYGSSFLNSDEQQRKEQVRKQLNHKIQEIQGNVSPRVLAEALRELLREVENINIKRNNL